MAEAVDMPSESSPTRFDYQMQRRRCCNLRSKGTASWLGDSEPQETLRRTANRVVVTHDDRFEAGTGAEELRGVRSP
jgi:hypothetical protein